MPVCGGVVGRPGRTTLLPVPIAAPVIVPVTGNEPADEWRIHEAREHPLGRFPIIGRQVVVLVFCPGIFPEGPKLCDRSAQDYEAEGCGDDTGPDSHRSSCEYKAI